VTAQTIALMLESDGPGGAEIMLLHLAEGLRERGYEVCPVLPDVGPGWLGPQFSSRGFTPETFTLRSPVDWKCVRGLMRLFERRRVDLVHGHEFTMAVYGAAACWLTGRPLVITMHGNRRFADQWRRRAALKWAIRRSRGTAAVSGALAGFTEHRLGLERGSVAVVPNGISFTPGNGAGFRGSLGLAPDEPLIIAVGNLYPVKGHIVLVRALARLARERPELRWQAAIAGRGQEEAAVRACAEEAGIASRVHLLGYRTDVPDILAAGDLWVMPSLSEGLPIALLEAMLAGKAIVSSAVGGIPDVLSGGAGRLVPAWDDAALAAALAELLEDPSRRDALAAEAFRRADRSYRREQMVDAYMALYQLPPG
jgi:glycosyltransferase involved in cell wall biosynthesis